MGVESMDAQHKRLVELVNRLNTAMVEGKSREVLGAIFVELIDYTVKHFSDEEALLKEHGYPELEVHQRKHRGLTAEVTKLKAQFDASSVGIGVKVMTFLEDWLAKHINGTDKLYGAFINKKG